MDLRDTIIRSSMCGGGGGGSSGDLDALISKTITHVESDTCTAVGDYVFFRHTLLESINFPSAISVGEDVFSGCSSLKSVNLPAVSSIKNNVFMSCTSLESINLPAVTKVGACSFYNCTSLKSANLPAVTSVEDSSFYKCLSLKSVDLSAATSIKIYGFYNCYSLTEIIIRTSDRICTLDSRGLVNCYHFDGTVDSTYNPNGLKDGYIYVPSSLVDRYKSAWKTYADQFRALEDYTVDGTITGELDPNKI